MQPSTHHRALTVTVSKTTMAQALITSALYTIAAAERVNQGTVQVPRAWAQCATA